MATQVLAGLLAGIWDGFSRAIDNDWNFLLVSLLVGGLLVWWSGRRGWERRRHVLAVVLLCVVASLLLKPMLAVPRPCALGEISRIPCPNEFSLPSIHASVSFALALAFLGLDIFPLALLWALAVAASRLWLGVHTFTDIGAGLALAVLAMAVVDGFGIGEPVLKHKNVHRGGAAPSDGNSRRDFGSPEPKQTAVRKHDEFSRKAVQAALGLLVAVYAMAVGAEAAAVPVAWALVAGLALFHLKHRKMGLPVIDSVLQWLERPAAPPGYGALTFFAGLLAVLVFLPQMLAVAMVLVLSIADALAGIGGQWAKKNGWHFPLHHNPDKSYVGSLLFALSAIPAYLLAGWAGVAAALLAAVAESLPLPVDDNLLIAWAGVAVVLLMKLI